jgi:hypothetical protein
MTPEQVAERALEILGPGGEHWTKHALTSNWRSQGARGADGSPVVTLTGSPNFCLVGALAGAAGHLGSGCYTAYAWSLLSPEIRRAVCDAIDAVSPGAVSPGWSPGSFNDDNATTWDDVRTVLEKVRAG